MLNVALSVVLALGTAQAQKEQEPIVLPSGAWVAVPDVAGRAAIVPVKVGNERRVRFTLDGVVFEAVRLRFKSRGAVYDVMANGDGTLSAQSYPVGSRP